MNAIACNVTTAYIGLALGFCLGFALCAVMTMARRSSRT